MPTNAQKIEIPPTSVSLKNCPNTYAEFRTKQREVGKYQGKEGVWEISLTRLDNKAANLEFGSSYDLEEIMNALTQIQAIIKEREGALKQAGFTIG